MKHILLHITNQDTIIGTLFTPIYPQGKGVTAIKMNRAIKYIVKMLDLDKKVYFQIQAGNHSLKAGGAMAKHLNQVDHNTIKKMGR